MSRYGFCPDRTILGLLSRCPLKSVPSHRSPKRATLPFGASGDSADAGSRTTQEAVAGSRTDNDGPQSEGFHGSPGAGATELWRGVTMSAHETWRLLSSRLLPEELRHQH